MEEGKPSCAWNEVYALRRLTPNTFVTSRETGPEMAQLGRPHRLETLELEAPPFMARVGYL